MKAVRRDKWKYVIDGASQMLFDLNTDAGERNDLFHLQPRIVNELSEVHKKWEKSL